MTFVMAQASNPIVRWEYFVDEWDQILEAVVQHLELTVVSVLVGFILSAGLAALALRFGWAAGPINGFTAFLYTIPSVALFAILVPYFGFSRVSAIIPLALYTLLIIETNIVAGFVAVPADVRDAADGMGMSPVRRVFTVELPLAMPYIITGLRIAVVSTVGLVTVAAIIGGNRFGGLGQFITEGLQTNFDTKIYLGAVGSVILAFVVDGLLVALQRLLTPWTRARAESS